MGRIVRCSSEKAVHPMYVSSAGIHLYSLEELSYFLQNFLYLIDETFFDSELLRFLREELKRQDLAELVQSQRIGKKPMLLAGELAFAAGDMNPEERLQLKRKMEQFQRLSECGRKKLQADQLFARGAYEQARILYVELIQIWENQKAGTISGDAAYSQIQSGSAAYSRIQSSSAAQSSRAVQEMIEKVDAGKAYYALGKIDMFAFSWKTAGAAFQQAYELLQEESILQMLYELSCISPVEVCEKSIFANISGMTLRNWQEIFNRKKEWVEQSLAEKDYEAMQENGTMDANGESEAEVVFQKWKQDFRKVCKSL